MHSGGTRASSQSGGRGAERLYKWGGRRKQGPATVAALRPHGEVLLVALALGKDDMARVRWAYTGSTWARGVGLVRLYDCRLSWRRPWRAVLVHAKMEVEDGGAGCLRPWLLEYDGKKLRWQRCEATWTVLPQSSEAQRWATIWMKVVIQTWTRNKLEGKMGCVMRNTYIDCILPWWWFQKKLAYMSTINLFSMYCILCMLKNNLQYIFNYEKIKCQVLYFSLVPNSFIFGHNGMVEKLYTWWKCCVKKQGTYINNFSKKYNS
jgi:hypothetical protein